MSRKPSLLFVVGARPNFVKAAPVVERVARGGYFRSLLVHTGQHYDAALSDLFFRDLALPEPDVYLGVGSGSHAVQTAKIMLELEPVLLEMRPACVVLFGDINSTVAASLTAAKLGIPIAHVEAGLRSFDRTMPEEINRIVTDSLSDLLFTTELSAGENLRQAGIEVGKIHFVGNTMVDSLLHHLPQARELRTDLLARLGVAQHDYAVLTLHRPSNVDEPAVLGSIMEAVATVSQTLPIVFPVHPRTRRRIDEGLALGPPLRDYPQLHLVEPMGYLEFLCLMDSARLVLTDSGGIQEETTAVGIPCLTLRENTERPVTITHGTNRLIGREPQAIVSAAAELRQRSVRGMAGTMPPLWDGQAAVRIADILHRTFSTA